MIIRIKYLVPAFLLALVSCSSRSPHEIERGELSRGLYTNNSLGIMYAFDPSAVRVGAPDDRHLLVEFTEVTQDTLSLDKAEEVVLAVFISLKEGYEVTMSLVNPDYVAGSDLKKYLYYHVNRDMKARGLELEMRSSGIEKLTLNGLDYECFSVTYSIPSASFSQSLSYAYLETAYGFLLFSFVDSSNPMEKTPDKKVLMNFLSGVMPL